MIGNMHTTPTAMRELTSYGWAARRATQYMAEHHLTATHHETLPDTMETIGWRSPVHSAAAWFGSAAVRDALCRITRARWSARNIVAQRLGGKPIVPSTPETQLALQDRLATAAEARRWAKAASAPEVYYLFCQPEYVPHTMDDQGGVYDFDNYWVRAHPGIIRHGHFYEANNPLRLNREIISGDGTCRQANRRRFTASWLAAERIARYLHTLGRVSGRRARELLAMDIDQLDQLAAASAG